MITAQDLRVSFESGDTHNVTAYINSASDDEHQNLLKLISPQAVYGKHSTELGNEHHHGMNSGCDVVSSYVKMMLASEALRERAIVSVVRNIQSMVLTGREAVHCLSELYVAVSSSANASTTTLTSHFLRELCYIIINPAFVNDEGNSEAHCDNNGAVIDTVHDDTAVRSAFSNGVAQCFDLITCIFRASVMSTSGPSEEGPVAGGAGGDGDGSCNGAETVPLTRQVVDKLLGESWEPRAILPLSNLMVEVFHYISVEQVAAFRKKLASFGVINKDDYGGMIRVTMSLAERCCDVNWVLLLRQFRLCSSRESDLDVKYFIDLGLSSSTLLMELVVAAYEAIVPPAMKRIDSFNPPIEYRDVLLLLHVWHLSNIDDYEESMDSLRVRVLRCATGIIYAVAVNDATSSRPLYQKIQTVVTYDLVPSTDSHLSSALVELSLAWMDPDVALWGRYTKSAWKDLTCNETKLAFSMAASKCIAHVFAESPEARNEILSTLFSVIAEDAPLSILRNYSQALTCIFSESVYSLGPHMVKVRDMLGYLTTFNGQVSHQVLRASLPLCQADISFRNFLLILLRKLLHSRDVEGKKLAIDGFVNLLSWRLVTEEGVEEDISSCLVNAVSYSMEIRNVLYTRIALAASTSMSSATGSSSSSSSSAQKSSAFTPHASTVLLDALYRRLVRYFPYCIINDREKGAHGVVSKHGHRCAERRRVFCLTRCFAKVADKVLQVEDLAKLLQAIQVVKNGLPAMLSPTVSAQLADVNEIVKSLPNSLRELCKKEYVYTEQAYEMEGDGDDVCITACASADVTYAHRLSLVIPLAAVIVNEGTESLWPLLATLDEIWSGLYCRSDNSIGAAVMTAHHISYRDAHAVVIASLVAMSNSETAVDAVKAAMLSACHAFSVLIQVLSVDVDDYSSYITPTAKRILTRGVVEDLVRLFVVTLAPQHPSGDTGTVEDQLQDEENSSTINGALTPPYMDDTNLYYTFRHRLIVLLTAVTTSETERGEPSSTASSRAQLFCDALLRQIQSGVPAKIVQANLQLLESLNAGAASMVSLTYLKLLASYDIDQVAIVRRMLMYIVRAGSLEGRYTAAETIFNSIIGHESMDLDDEDGSECGGGGGGGASSPSFPLRLQGSAICNVALNETLDLFAVLLKDASYLALIAKKLTRLIDRESEWQIESDSFKLNAAIKKKILSMLCAIFKDCSTAIRIGKGQSMHSIHKAVSEYLIYQQLSLTVRKWLLKERKVGDCTLKKVPTLLSRIEVFSISLSYMVNQGVGTLLKGCSPAPANGATVTVGENPNVSRNDSSNSHGSSEVERVIQEIMTKMGTLLKRGEAIKKSLQSKALKDTNTMSSSGAAVLNLKKRKRSGGGGSRLRSRNAVVDSWLREEGTGVDSYADLEDFIC